MFIYKIICQANKKSYIGVCEEEPNLYNIDLPKEIQEDLDNFGKDKFLFLKVCELNNKEKAKRKAEILTLQEANVYEEEKSESFFAEKD